MESIRQVIICSPAGYRCCGPQSASAPMRLWRPLADEQSCEWITRRVVELWQGLEEPSAKIK